MKHLSILLVLLLGVASGDTYPKREFRAAWVSTAWGLDYPYNNFSQGQQNEIRFVLDSLRNNGYNAVIFQVRPGCDAFYESAYEPWSHHLQGASGQAPSPYFDPLQVYIQEAHARGMELHACSILIG